MFDQVDLVDDIDQVSGFHHAPEYAVVTQAQFPFPVAEGAGKQEVCFPQVEMGSTAVCAVVAEIGRHVEDAARFVFEIEVGFRYEPARVGTLALEKGGLGKPPAFRGQPARQVDVVVSGLAVRGSWMRRGTEQADAKPQEENQAPRGHHRTRLSPVRVKSRSSMSVPNW